MKTIYNYKSTIPYSLHDMRIYKIDLKEDNLFLYFENGFVETKEPYNQVKGNIIIENTDFDFCCVHLLSKDGKYGKFKGKKLDIAKFLKKYSKFSFEVVDEMYGYNQVCYSGFLSVANKRNTREINISIYYTGNIVYDTSQ